MQLNQITPLILTFNEAPNIARCLDKLSWAHKILVIDSFSSDETLLILARHPNVKVFQRKFDSHAAQRNYGLAQVSTPWVLSFDADYILTPEFVPELEGLRLSDELSACHARFRYCVFGVPLRASLYPPRPVLFLKSKCLYREDGHTENLQINGRTASLTAALLHDDRKPFDRWLAEQCRYAALEARELSGKSFSDLKNWDKIRRMIFFAPIIICVYSLVMKGLIFESLPGCYYVAQRALFELILSLKLIENKIVGNRLDRI
ncbi:MAG: glycosyltransferase family 2 protein [Limisphaerales bacterium]